MTRGKIPDKLIAVYNKCSVLSLKAAGIVHQYKIQALKTQAEVTKDSGFRWESLA